VMTSVSLSALYGSPVEGIRSGGRILVAGVPDRRLGAAGLESGDHHP